MKNIIAVSVLLILAPIITVAQGNAFSFQGRLNDGANPANGRYDLEFKLFDATLDGTQIGPTVLRPNTTLINGVFSTTLDFGAVAFQNQGATFIEIAVKPSSSPNAYTTLGPRQQLTVVPYASRAQNSTNADNAAQLGGIAASEYITRTNGGADFIRNSTQTQINSNFNISGTGIINGNLSVGGDQSVAGSQTVAGISNLVTINASGNAIQSGAARGFIKAMLYVSGGSNSSPPQIFRCFNGFTNNSVAPCGLTVVEAPGLVGAYNIYFGASVAGRFVSVSAEYAPPSSPAYNRGINYRFSTTDNTRIDVFTFATDNQADTTRGNFMLILY